jgi:hypothetical protein
MKTLWRFLHADSLRRVDAKRNHGLHGFTDKNRAPISVIPTEVEESLVFPKDTNQKCLDSARHDTMAYPRITSSQTPPLPPTLHPEGSVRIRARDPDTFWPASRPDKIPGTVKTEFSPR